jgi:hypothetical protein
MQKQPYQPQVVSPAPQQGYPQQPYPTQGGQQAYPQQPSQQPSYQQPAQQQQPAQAPANQQAAYQQQQAQYNQQLRAYQEYQRQQLLLQQQAQQQQAQQQYYQQNPHAQYHEAHAQQAQQRPYQQPAYWQQPAKQDETTQLPQPRPEKQRQVYHQLQQRLFKRPQDDHSWRKALIILMIVFGLIGFSLGYFVQSRQSHSSTPVAADNGRTSSGEMPVPGAEPDEDVTVSLDAIVRADMLRILTKVEAFSADNNGRLPNPSSLEDISELNTKYLGEDLKSPITGDPYIFVESNPERGQVRLYTGVVCGSNPGERVAGSSRNFSIQTPLTDGTYYCIDNTTVSTTEG